MNSIGIVGASSEKSFNGMKVELTQAYIEVGVECPFSIPLQEWLGQVEEPENGVANNCSCRQKQWFNYQYRAQPNLKHHQDLENNVL